DARAPKALLAVAQSELELLAGDLSALDQEFAEPILGCGRGGPDDVAVVEVHRARDVHMRAGQDAGLGAGREEADEVDQRKAAFAERPGDDHLAIRVRAILLRYSWTIVQAPQYRPLGPGAHDLGLLQTIAKDLSRSLHWSAKAAVRHQ